MNFPLNSIQPYSIDFFTKYYDPLGNFLKDAYREDVTCAIRTWKQLKVMKRDQQVAFDRKEFSMDIDWSVVPHHIKNKFTHAVQLKNCSLPEFGEEWKAFTGLLVDMDNLLNIQK